MRYKVMETEGQSFVFDLSTMPSSEPTRTCARLGLDSWDDTPGVTVSYVDTPPPNCVMFVWAIKDNWGAGWQRREPGYIND